MIDLTGLSVKQLDAVVQSAQQRKEFLQKRPSAARVRAQVVKYVAGYGYSIEELFGSAPSRRTAAARRAPVKRAERPARCQRSTATRRIRTKPGPGVEGRRAGWPLSWRRARRSIGS